MSRSARFPQETILVTGGTGLVGKGIKHIIETLKCPEFGSLDNEVWIFLSSKDGDLRYSDTDKNVRSLQGTEEVFKRFAPTQAIHLAAKVGGLFKNMACNAEMLRENILINSNVLFCCKKYNVKKVVSCLSTCIFPDETAYPIDESMIHNGPPHPSNFGYAHAKRTLDIESRSVCVVTLERIASSMAAISRVLSPQMFLALRTTLTCRIRTLFPALSVGASLPPVHSALGF